jgi:hypothetical protein
MRISLQIPVHTLLISLSCAQKLSLNIPAKEAATLSQIQEDQPPPDASRKSDWISPVYSPIYGSPLPIPPIKQPNKCVY